LSNYLHPFSYKKLTKNLEWKVSLGYSQTIVLLFPEKEAKSVVLLRRKHGYLNLHLRIRAFQENSCRKIYSLRDSILLFPEKEAKSVVLLRRRPLAAQPSAKPTLGVWGLAPKKNSIQRVLFKTSEYILLFPEKRSKKRGSASQKAIGCPTLGQADPGVWRLTLKERINPMVKG
jgi:hypothetical protein